MVLRRSIFNLVPIETNPEPIGTNVGDLIKEKINENNITVITNTGKIKEESEIKEYAVQVKVTKEREIRLITYLVKATDKLEAEELAIEKAVSNGYEKDKVSSTRVLKSSTGVKESDILFERIKINYEVTFVIKIGQDKYRKVFIINAKDQTDARNSLILRCKKEFKNYRTINKVEIKEADENSVESSELIVEGGSPSDVKQEKSEGTKIQEMQETADDYIKGIANKFIDEELENLPAELKQIGIAEVTIQIRNKEAREFLKDDFGDGKTIFKANSLQDAEKQTEERMKESGLNRKIKRQLKHSYRMTNFGEFLKSEFLDHINNGMKKSFKEFAKQIQDEEDEDKKSEILDDPNEFNSELYEDMFRKSFKKVFERIKGEILDAIDEKDNYSDAEVSHILVYKDEIIKKYEKIGKMDNGEWIIRKKGGLPLAKPPKVINCKVVTKDKKEIMVNVQAENSNEALKVVVYSIQDGMMAQDISSLQEVLHISFLDGKKYSTVEIGSVEVK